MDTEILQINTIDSYNSLFGLETRHPLVAVVDLAEPHVSPPISQ